jgi:hypothetical protein
VTCHFPPTTTATPKSEQSLAYLLRNDILTNVEDLLAELIYLVEKSSTKDDNTADAKAMAVGATVAIQKYLSIVPPNELAQARRLYQLEQQQPTSSQKAGTSGNNY